MNVDHHHGVALACACALTAFAAVGAPVAHGATKPAPHIKKAPAKAPLTPGFSVAPIGQTGIFRTNSRPGATVHGRLRITNLRKRSITITLAAADATTADSGGVSFRGGKPRAIGSWLTLSRTAVPLRAGSSTIVRFSARVPAATTGGEHYAGIVAVDAAMARKAAAPSHHRGVSVRKLTRFALPVKITTPGALVHHLSQPSMAFGVDASGSQLRVALRNDGTIITRNTTIKLNVMRGTRTLFRVDERVVDFLPGTAIAFPVAWRGRLAPGTYRVTGTIRPRSAPVIHVDRKVSFTPKQGKQLEHRSGIVAAAPPGGSGTPVLLLVALAAALGIAGFAVASYVRLRRRLAAAADRQLA